MLAACAVSPSYTNSTSQGADRAHRYSLCSFRWHFSEHVFWTASCSPGGANFGVQTPAQRCARLPQVNRAKLRGAKMSDAELSSS